MPNATGKDSRRESSHAQKFEPSRHFQHKLEMFQRYGGHFPSDEQLARMRWLLLPEDKFVFDWLVRTLKRLNHPCPCPARVYLRARPMH